MTVSTKDGLRNLIICLVIGGGAWYLFGGGFEKHQDAQRQATYDEAAKDMRAIYDQVSKDSVEQYAITVRQGTPIDICVHAGMVSAAYLQAKDESNYRKWKAKEAEDCNRAGVPQ